MRADGDGGALPELPLPLPPTFEGETAAAAAEAFLGEEAADAAPSPSIISGGGGGRRLGEVGTAEEAVPPVRTSPVASAAVTSLSCARSLATVAESSSQRLVQPLCYFTVCIIIIQF